MNSLVTVVTVLRWVVAAFFALCILHPAKADDCVPVKTRDAIKVSISSCGAGYITTNCYPPTGRVH